MTETTPPTEHLHGIRRSGAHPPDIEVATEVQR